MPQDKYKAIWLSHSSISDFLKCPRAYFLRNVYKDPKTRHKITITKPPLSLGQVVHDVIESLSTLPSHKRLEIPLSKRYDFFWKKVSGKIGGFKTESEEKEYKDRGLQMIEFLQENPGPLIKKALKLKSEDGLPYYWFDEEKNIILCGKVDWLEYLDKDNSVHIIDFKTGKSEDDESSLQLPIYLLLTTNLQKRPIKKASYWYLEKKDEPNKVKLPDLDDAQDKVEEVARRIKLSRQIDHFKCPFGGCFVCTPLERVLKGEGEKVGVSEYGQDIYII